MKNIFPFFVLFFLTIFSSSSFAQAGSLDPTFGVGGKVVTNLPYCTEFVVAPDGKLLFLGAEEIDGLYLPTIYRLNADGSTDSTFGTNGRTIIHVDDGQASVFPSEKASSFIILDNGDIMVAGTYVEGLSAVHSSIVLVKLHSNGLLDTDFGNNGKKHFAFAGLHATTGQIRKYSNGDFLVWGKLEGNIVFDSTQITFIRFKADGELDTSFGPDGIGIIKHPIDSLSPFIGTPFPKINITPDEKVVLAGTELNALYTSRYNFDGSIDTTFGINGQAIAGGIFFGQFREMLVQLDGKILSVGSSYVNGDPNFTLVRQNVDGSLDQSFGSNGLVLANLATYGSYINSVALQSDGKIVVAGTGEFGFNGTSKWIIVRYQANGLLDVGFGNNGVIINNFGDAETGGIAYELAIGNDHSIYVAGSGLGWTIAKYNSGIYTATKDPHARQKEFSARISPNLSRPGETFSLTYHLQNNSTVSAQLLDTKGQIVQVFFMNKTQTSGEQTLELQWKEDLPAGFYILSLQMENGRAMLPVILKQ